MTSNKDYIAIDIAKNSLQVQAPDKACALTYDSEGLKELLKMTSKNTVVVCEATGGYERTLISFLNERKVPVALVSPDRVRAFARSDGLRAKTDPLDAAILLRFAQQKHPAILAPVSKEQARIAALLERRSHLSEMLAQEKNRLENSSPLIRRNLLKMIRLLESEIKAIDGRIRKVVRSEQSLHQKEQVMLEVTGVGEITAWTILAYLDEITHTNRSKIAALAGVAPFNKDSGKTIKRRHIQAGRAKVRRVLYMATKTAAIHNPHIKAYVDRLRFENGKPYKWAIVAAMRKLLIHLQVRLKNYEASLA